MKTLLHSSDRSSKGAALMIVLAFVVLLTGLTLAYFSRTGTDRQLAQSSFNDTDADLLARSALDIVIGDLKQEIFNGSTVSTVGNYTIYTPTSNANMLSQLSGTPSPVPTPSYNMIRRSIRSDPMPAPGVGSRASAVNSNIDVSLNKRSISPARWNRHYLIPRSTASPPPSPNDTTPISSFVAPDWVIVTRAGPTPCASWPPDNRLANASPTNTNYAIGRYAYAIYDEGGLIDVNVKGFPLPSPSPATYVQSIGRKGSGVFADLSQLANMSSTGINNLIGWRNYASAQPGGDLVSNFTFGLTSATNFVNYVSGNSNGFLSTSGQTWAGWAGNGTDQAFINRQELINFRAATTGGIFTANALQYLGTFSRELNGPTWKPSTPAGSNIDYAALAENSTAINRDLATVRVTGAFTRADGTQAIVGEPLLKTRFPLTRINELTNIANAYIQRDFGLIWNAGQNRWDYVGATGSIVQSAIERLDQVAAENREPNFFEILKAVILSGSVGLGSSGDTFVIAEAKYSNADHQIMQIGANIIDAWDSDNIPTFINFGGNELAGVENLPYLNKIIFGFWISSHGNDGLHDKMKSWLIPSLWNPHQNASAAPASQDVRFAMTGSGLVSAWLILDNNPAVQIGPLAIGSYVGVKANAFSVPSPPLPANERGAKQGFTLTTDFSTQYDAIGLDLDLDLGTTIPKQAYKHVSKVYPIFATNTNFEMQLSVNGQWKTYQSWKNCSNGILNPLIFNQGAPDYKDVSFQDPKFVSLDPRTVRFGIWGSAASETGSANYNTGAEDSMDQMVASGGLMGVAAALRPQPPAAFPMSTPPGKTYLRGYWYAANTTTTDYYNDLDGVKRPGDWTTNPPFDGVSSTKTIMYASASPSPSPAPLNYQDRPRIPNEQFQSVAELGQVFRDQPWKTLNFTTPNSGDAGLLDAFSLQDVPMMAGRTSLNTRQTPVLAALLSQATKNLVGTSVITSSQANNIVTALTALTAANPMISKGELVTRLAADPSVAALGNQEARECVVRAFSDACQTRTWNLMIDVVAQSGHYPPNASTLAGFMVEGEKRYWLHVAIDRFTGQIVDQQLEAVYE